jgi:hypothetical protein
VGRTLSNVCDVHAGAAENPRTLKVCIYSLFEKSEIEIKLEDKSMGHPVCSVKLFDLVSILFQGVQLTKMSHGLTLFT